MNSFRAALKFFNKDALNANGISYRLSETNLGENSINKTRNSEASLQRNITKSREYGMLMKEIISRPRSAASSRVDVRQYSKHGYPWNSVCKEKEEEGDEDDCKEDNRSDKRECKKASDETTSANCEDVQKKAEATKKEGCQSVQNAPAPTETAFKPHRLTPKEAEGRDVDALCQKRKRIADGLNRGISSKESSCNVTSHSTKVTAKCAKSRKPKRKCRCNTRRNPCGRPESVTKTRRIVRKILSCQSACKKRMRKNKRKKKDLFTSDECKKTEGCKKRRTKRKRSCSRPRRNPCGAPKIGRSGGKSKKSKPKRRKVCGREVGKRKKIPNKQLVGKVCSGKRRRRQKLRKKIKYPWGATKTAQQVLEKKARRAKRAKKLAKKKSAKKPYKTCKTVKVQCKYKRCKRRQRKPRAITAVYKKHDSCKDKGGARYPWDSIECVKLLEHRCKKRIMPPRRPSIKTLRMFARLSKERLERQDRRAAESEMSDCKEYHSMTSAGPRPIFLDDTIGSMVTRSSSSSAPPVGKDCACKPADCNYLFCISGIDCKVYPSTCKKLNCGDLDSRRDILCKLCHIFNTSGARSVSKYFGKSYQNKEYFLYTDASFYDVHGFMSRMRVPAELVYRIH